MVYIYNCVCVCAGALAVAAGGAETEGPADSFRGGKDGLTAEGGGGEGPLAADQGELQLHEREQLTSEWHMVAMTTAKPRAPLASF